MGNRLSRQDSASGTTSYAYNAANMLTASTGTNGSAYTPDADGDTLTGGGRVNTWDAQNRLASCTLNNVTTTFTYGADGLRRSMTSATGVTTYYVYDGQSMIREMRKNGSGVLVPTATYLTGPRGPEYRRDDTQTETDGQGHTFGVTRWYVYDGLGSVVGEVDPLGNLTCADEYDVYGAVRGRTGTATTAHGFVGSLGHLSDASTGLVYMKARYYDPSVGRFASEDPKGADGNWYAYCKDDPINLTDSDGQSAKNLLVNDWLLLAGWLFYRGCLNIRMGFVNAGEGYAAVIEGRAVEAAGQTWDSSLIGQLIGTASAASGEQLQASGANAVQFGCLEALTGALQIFASQIIFADQDELGEGSTDLAQSALQMATQHL